MTIHTEDVPITFGISLSDADLVKLQTWFSPSFPIGAFSYSHGLEWVVGVGEVNDAAALASWAAGILDHGAGRSDAVLLSTTWRAVVREDWDQVAELAQLAAALQPSLERRMESLSQGTAFLAAVGAAWSIPSVERLQRARSDETSYAIAAGVAAAAHGLPLGAVLVAYLHSFAANLVSAGVRLVPLGQTDGLRVLVQLEPVIRQVAEQACSATIEEIGSSSFLADIASMRHETQYTRLFRS